MRFQPQVTYVFQYGNKTFMRRQKQDTYIFGYGDLSAGDRIVAPKHHALIAHTALKTHTINIIE